MAVERDIEEYHARLLKAVKKNGSLNLGNLPQLGLSKPKNLPAKWKTAITQLPGLILTSDYNCIELASDTAPGPADCASDGM